MGHQHRLPFVMLLAVAALAQGCAGEAAIPRASTESAAQASAPAQSINPAPTPPAPSAAPPATPAPVSPSATDTPGALVPATREPGSWYQLDPRQTSLLVSMPLAGQDWEVSVASWWDATTFQDNPVPSPEAGREYLRVAFTFSFVGDSPTPLTVTGYQFELLGPIQEGTGWSKGLYVYKPFAYSDPLINPTKDGIPKIFKMLFSVPRGVPRMLFAWLISSSAQTTTTPDVVWALDRLP